MHRVVVHVVRPLLPVLVHESVGERVGGEARRWPRAPLTALDITRASAGISRSVCSTSQVQYAATRPDSSSSSLAPRQRKARALRPVRPCGAVAAVRGQRQIAPASESGGPHLLAVRDARKHALIPGAVGRGGRRAHALVVGAGQAGLAGHVVVVG